MSHFSSMLDALALAVQTLADGGGPFWEADTAKRPTDDHSVPADSEKKEPVPAEPYQSLPKK